jgi:hypothetical protein
MHLLKNGHPAHVFTRLLCPRESAPEAALAGIEPVALSHLAEAGAYLRGRHEPEPVVCAR